MTTRYDAFLVTTLAVAREFTYCQALTAESS